MQPKNKLGRKAFPVPPSAHGCLCGWGGHWACLWPLSLFEKWTCHQPVPVAYHGDSCVGYLYVGAPSQAYPAPCTYIWAPWGSRLWMGHIITVPSMWSEAGSSFDPHVGSQHPISIANSIVSFAQGDPTPLLLSHSQSGWGDLKSPGGRPDYRQLSSHDCRGEPIKNSDIRMVVLQL